jgi:hypothetical protein
MKHFKPIRFLAIVLCVGFLTVPLQQVHSQERRDIDGELKVKITNATSPSIVIQATSSVHGSRADGFPLVNGWNS